MMRSTIVPIGGRIVRRWMRVLSLVSVLSVGLGTLASLNARSLTWLGTLGGYWSVAWGVSADGRVVVGKAQNASGDQHAFRWENGVMQDLGHLVSNWSEAYGVSADGRVVVGVSGNADYDRHAFRWVQGRGMEDLGTLGGDWSEALGVSADGMVVVGWADDTSSQPHAFRWVEGQGMEDLNITYTSLLTDGSRLEEAHAISPDGRYIVGGGYHASLWRLEAFLLDTWRTGDTNGDGCIDDADLLAVLFAFGSPGTGYTRHEDINKDGVVDDADLLEVLFNFGSGC